MHSYKVREKVIEHEKNANKYEEPYKGLYPITHVWKNRTASIRRGAAQYCINIRWIKTYHK